MESQNETPMGAAAGPEGPRPQVRALNRNILSAVASLLSEGSVLSDAGRVGSKAAVQPPATSRGHQQAPATSRLEYEAARRWRECTERHRLLQATREQDEARIQERLERASQAREARFEALLEGLQREAPLRVEASQAVREHEAERRAALSAREGSCAGARELRERRAEARFHRAASLALAPTPRGEAREAARRRQLEEEAAAARGRARPALEVQAWGPLERLASPHAQLARAPPGEAPRTGRRLGAGAHRVDESDGVPAAGKTRTRFEHNVLGMLEGNLAREGEAARHRSHHGASSGAPCQDHFFFEQGNSIVDAEFPTGKRSYLHVLA